MTFQKTSGTFISQGGNTFALSAIIGTNDENPVLLRTAGIDRVDISETGEVTLLATGIAEDISAQKGSYPLNWQLSLWNGSSEQTPSFAQHAQALNGFAFYALLKTSFEGTDLLVLDHAGHFGINNTLPEAMLDVVGKADELAFRVQDSSGNRYIVCEEFGGVPKIGFFSAPPVFLPSVTGSQGGNSLIHSLVTALAQLGLILDNTTP